MNTCADALHTAIFGRHRHPCPSPACNGALRPCSGQACYAGEKRWCDDCNSEAEELMHLRHAWREVDRIMQKGVGV